MVSTQDAALVAAEPFGRLGQVPFVPRIQRRRWFGGRPRDEFAQALLVLAQSIRQVARTRPLSTILIASGLPGDGRTTVAANLALALASAPTWVALVDGDARGRAGLGALFENRRPGHDQVQSVAAGFRTYSVDDTPGLTLVLPQAPLDPQAAAAQVGPVITSLGAAVEFAIIDSPPCGQSAGGFLLSTSVDAVLYVVRRRNQDVDAQRRIQQQFRQLGAYELGIVFNDA